MFEIEQNKSKNNLKKYYWNSDKLFKILSTMINLIKFVIMISRSPSRIIPGSRSRKAFSFQSLVLFL